MSSSVSFYRPAARRFAEGVTPVWVLSQNYDGGTSHSLHSHSSNTSIHSTFNDQLLRGTQQILPANRWVKVRLGRDSSDLVTLYPGQDSPLPIQSNTADPGFESNLRAKVHDPPDYQMETPEWAYLSGGHIVQEGAQIINNILYLTFSRCEFAQGYFACEVGIYVNGVRIDGDFNYSSPQLLSSVCDFITYSVNLETGDYTYKTAEFYNYSLTSVAGYVKSAGSTGTGGHSGIGFEFSGSASYSLVDPSEAYYSTLPDSHPYYSFGVDYFRNEDADSRGYYQSSSGTYSFGVASYFEGFNSSNYNWLSYYGWTDNLDEAVNTGTTDEPSNDYQYLNLLVSRVEFSGFNRVIDFHKHWGLSIVNGQRIAAFPSSISNNLAGVIVLHDYSIPDDVEASDIYKNTGLWSDSFNDYSPIDLDESEEAEKWSTGKTRQEFFDVSGLSGDDQLKFFSEGYYRYSNNSVNDVGVPGSLGPDDTDHDLTGVSGAVFVSESSYEVGDWYSIYYPWRATYLDIFGVDELMNGDVWFAGYYII